MGRCSLSERHPMCRLVNEKYKYILINDRLPQSRRLRMSLGRSAVLSLRPIWRRLFSGIEGGTRLGWRPRPRANVISDSGTSTVISFQTRSRVEHSLASRDNQINQRAFQQVSQWWRELERREFRYSPATVSGLPFRHETRNQSIAENLSSGGSWRSLGR